MHLVLHDATGAASRRFDDLADIALALAPLGVQVGQIAVSQRPQRGQAVVADAQALAGLHKRFGVRSADRVSLTSGDGRWPALRSRFRQRHTHSDHELRVFVRGQGLFELATPEGGRAQLLAEAGDWVAIPPGLPHAFDAGHQPEFDALRLFASAGGWVSTPTADATSAPLPDLDRVLAERRLLARPVETATA